MRLKFHTVVAIVVLIASGLWVATGKYAFVGSELLAADETTTQVEAPATEEPAAPPESTQSVAYVVATPASYVRQIRLSGETAPDKQVTLVARGSGIIGTITVAEGDRIAEKALVAALDAPEKRAAVESAQASYDNAVHRAETSARLYANGALPELQYDASITAREAARAALEGAKAELDRLEVHAPFGGIIDKVMVESGAWVQPGTPVATLLALDPIVVVGEINERDLQAVPKGTEAMVVFGNGASAKGVVRDIRRQASGLTRTFPIEVAIDNPDLLIPAGMSAELELSVQTEPAVLLPRSVVTLGPDGELGIRMLTNEDAVAFLKVTIVDDTPGGIVLTGIDAGTRIIVSGQNMVTDGQKVTAVKATDVPGATSGTE